MSLADMLVMEHMNLMKQRLAAPSPKPTLVTMIEKELARIDKKKKKKA